MQRKNTWPSVPAWRNLEISSWAKEFCLFPLDRNASHLARSNGPLPSVFAFTIMPKESHYGDRGIQLYNYFPLISENFRYVSYPLRKTFNYFFPGTILTFSMNSQIKQILLWLRPCFARIFPNFSKILASNFSTNSDRPGGVQVVSWRLMSAEAARGVTAGVRGVRER